MTALVGRKEHFNCGSRKKFERGQVLEKLGHQAEAFEAHTQCKALLKQKPGEPFNSAATMSTLRLEQVV